MSNIITPPERLIQKVHHQVDQAKTVKNWKPYLKHTITAEVFKFIIHVNCNLIDIKSELYISNEVREELLESIIDTFIRDRIEAQIKKLSLQEENIYNSLYTNWLSIEGLDPLLIPYSEQNNYSY